MENVKTYGKYLGISYLIAIGLLCLVSVIFAYTNINDNLLNIFVFGIVIVTVAIGAMCTSRKTKKKGIITGGVFSLIYFAVIYIIAVVFYAGFFFTPAVAIYLVICLISGMVGGVVGVNVWCKKY